jgi:hypothetical protein
LFPVISGTLWLASGIVLLPAIYLWLAVATIVPLLLVTRIPTWLVVMVHTWWLWQVVCCHERLVSAFSHLDQPFEGIGQVEDD